MQHPSLQRILQTAGIPDLIEILSKKLSPSDLQSLLLAVYQQQAEKVNPAQLKEQYLKNRFVKSSLVDPIRFIAFDQLAFAIAKTNFQPIELAPLAPLGSCSAIASVHQNKVVATSRNVEVMSDPTNVMALEGAIRREKSLKTHPKDKTVVNLCCSQRVTRAQFWNQPNSFAHFKLFALCSAGSDTGSYQFEKQQFEKHLTFYLDLMTAKDSPFHFPKVEVLITPIEKRLIPFLTDQLFPKLKANYPSVTFQIDDKRKKGIGYYETLCFHINAAPESGDFLNLVDGGFTDWTQKLVSNRKERCLISAIGSERAVLLFHR